MACMVDEWARGGVRHAVVCPGSRSTPLALALAADGRLSVHVRLDERSAAFIALGIGLAGEGPAILCTTSGTATAEVHAAVLEAHHARVPLVVCTADRPSELHDVGAPQTVEQRTLYGAAVRWTAEPGVAELATADTWRSVAARALVEAVANPVGPGPVHLNLAFREPLVGRPVAVPPGRPSGRPWHAVPTPDAPSDDVVRAALEELGLVAGSGNPDRIGPDHGSTRWVPGVVVVGGAVDDPSAVLALGRAIGWPVLADPRSGCRTGGPGVVTAVDAVLRMPAEAAALRPAAVLRLGAPWASKVLNQWLDALDPSVPQVLVASGWTWADPGRRTSLVVTAEPSAWCRRAVACWAAAGAATADDDTTATGAGAPAEGRWMARWSAVDRLAHGAIASWLAEQPVPTEPGVARTVLEAAPSGATVVLASSMPVRDAEWYGPVRPEPPSVVANRGANGIDGVVSTAVGVALTGRPVVALVGDLAFLHDLTAWVRPEGPEPDLTVVVVDNGGGGIFSFLPQASTLPEHVFTSLFATPQVVDPIAVATGLGVAVAEVQDLAQLTAVVAGCRGAGLRVARVRVGGGRANVADHDAIHAAIHAAVAAAVSAGLRH